MPRRSEAAALQAVDIDDVEGKFDSGPLPRPMRRRHDRMASGSAFARNSVRPTATHSPSILVEASRFSSVLALLEIQMRWPFRTNYVPMETSAATPCARSCASMIGSYVPPRSSTAPRIAVLCRVPQEDSCCFNVAFGNESPAARNKKNRSARGQVANPQRNARLCPCHVENNPSPLEKKWLLPTLLE
jgi:hypothetical protein